MSVVTRFAPSPTGMLHLGGARTALFNWLYARHHGGSFRLRLEDTDSKRSTPEAIAAIVDGLGWLGLDWDGEMVRQSARRQRHVEVAHGLLAAGGAYRCYCSPEELETMRAEARAQGRAALYDGRWRDRDPAEAPPGVDPVIRFRAPQEGETVISDLVQRRIKVDNSALDDMVLLRADGTPTYMLSVVVDDHDMGITHAIRGDDHLSNAFRQTQLFRALGWEPPAYAHIPLIHGADGAKLSKRHGAVAVGAYAELGILPAAMRNALLRLGWSHGDDEIIDTAQAIAWFDLDAVNRGAARFDMEKLHSLNGHYIRESADADLLAEVEPRLAATYPLAATAEGRRRIAALLPEAKARAKTLVELAENLAFLFRDPHDAMTPKARRLLDNLDPEAEARLGALARMLEELEGWDEALLERVVRAFAEGEGVGLGKIAQPLRAALTGSHASPGLFAVMAALGREETVTRLGHAGESGRSER
ncbi:MAG: glutamate--tRNA ligase [Rhodospirillales bacterium]|nr:glutamate--tRNA ligase [Rhodospirillales bacterium]MDE0379273.1 glutamate--tRNA ligase [Rhodospirillales bacterium]